MEIQSSCFIHENKKNKPNFFMSTYNNEITHDILYFTQSKFLNIHDNIIIKQPHKFQNTSPIKIINKNNTNEYSLNQIFFDPSESSPPNDFLNKLSNRMQKYQKNEINLCNE